MLDDKQPEKIYYSIGEVAAMFDLTVSNVRYWENEFDVLMPKKNSRGDRFFTKKDIENIRIIKMLMKEKGFTIEGAKKQLRESRDQLATRTKLVDSLTEIREFLSQLKLQLDEVPSEKTISIEQELKVADVPVQNEFNFMSYEDENAIID